MSKVVCVVVVSLVQTGELNVFLTGMFLVKKRIKEKCLTCSLPLLVGGFGVGVGGWGSGGGG